MRQLLSWIAVGVVAALASAPAPALAWEEEYVAEGIANAIEQAKTARDLSGFGCRSDGFCLLGGFVEQFKELSYTTALESGKGYLFVGAGDRDVKDMDLTVTATDGTFYKGDLEQDATPWVYVEPEKSTDFKITMALPKSDSPLGSTDFCIVVVLESDGLEGSLDTLGQSAQELNAIVGAIAKDAEVSFDTAQGSFCLLGALLADGGERKLTRSWKGEVSYVCAGWSDASAKDFDLDIKKEDEVLHQDIDDDATPVVTFTPAEDGRLTFRLGMFSAEKPSFAIAAILTK